MIQYSYTLVDFSLIKERLAKGNSSEALEDQIKVYISITSDKLIQSTFTLSSRGI